MYDPQPTALFRVSNLRGTPYQRSADPSFYQRSLAPLCLSSDREKDKWKGCRKGQYQTVEQENQYVYFVMKVKVYKQLTLKAKCLKKVF